MEKYKNSNIPETGEELILWREKRGWSQKKTAEELGYSLGRIAHIESNEREKKLAKRLQERIKSIVRNEYTPAANLKRKITDIEKKGNVYTETLFKVIYQLLEELEISKEWQQNERYIIFLIYSLYSIHNISKIENEKNNDLLKSLIINQLNKIMSISGLFIKSKNLTYYQYSEQPGEWARLQDKINGFF